MLQADENCKQKFHHETKTDKLVKQPELRRKPREQTQELEIAKQLTALHTGNSRPQMKLDERDRAFLETKKRLEGIQREQTQGNHNKKHT